MTYGMLLRGLFAAVVLAVWTAPSALSALAESRPALTRDLQSIVDAKVLRVALTRYDLPSFHVRGPDGALLGPEIEMARQLARALGVRAEFVNNPESFDAVVDFVENGRAGSGIRKLSQTYNRLKRVRFSETYL